MGKHLRSATPLGLAPPGAALFAGQERDVFWVDKVEGGGFSFPVSTIVDVHKRQRLQSAIWHVQPNIGLNGWQFALIAHCHWNQSTPNTSHTSE